MTARRPLTEKQQAIYSYMYEYENVHDYPPTIREIGEHFGIRSPNGVACHLLALAKKGWITKTPRMAYTALHTRSAEREIVAAVLTLMDAPTEQQPAIVERLKAACRKYRKLVPNG